MCVFPCVTVKDDEEVKSVTQQFCDWVASLGGDSNNIDEATITSLFASGYETKPALSVPIHVVELANVPPELRLSTALPPQPPPQSATARPRSLSCARVCHTEFLNPYSIAAYSTAQTDTKQVFKEF